MRILKFGGTSLATPAAIEKVVAIIRDAWVEGEVAVVVSALGGVTNRLEEMAESCRQRTAEPDELLAELEARHLAAVAALADPEEHDELVARTHKLLASLGEMLRGVTLVGEVSPRSLDRIRSGGELLSAPIVAAALRRAGLDAADADARELIVTDSNHGAARPDMELTTERLRKHFDRVQSIQVVPGFVGATVEGRTTTLGRGGSDFTASILGAALGAAAVELWTDVDGVMSADPRLVPGARGIPRLRYDELMEMSHFGAKVVHPPSVHPLRGTDAVLWIKNTFRPERPGTRVSNGELALEPDEHPIRGISSIDRVTMARLEGDGMVGVPGVAMRLFRALADHGVSVILISQASSEHSICFCFAPEDRDAAVEAVDREFEVDRRAGNIEALAIEEEVAIVAVIGAAMRERPGIAGRLFSVLGRQGINVRAIAQGSSELNISLVVSRGDEAAAVRAIHQSFFEPAPAGARVFVAGVGGVGGALLEHLAARPPAARPPLVLWGVANSSRSVIDPAGVAASAARERLSGEGTEGGLPVLLDALTAGATPGDEERRIFVDCTAAEGMAAVYERLLGLGVDVVTANKKPLAGPMSDYRRLTGSRRGRLFAETTVGAGLPVLGTLVDLLASGDQLTSCRGVLSGTAGFLAAELNRGAALSAAVARAAELGYTEPDPRDDLRGFDVARKLLILARLAGAELEWDDLEIEPVIPSDPWLGLEPAELTARLPELDDEFAARRDRALSGDRRLAYLASWDGERARIGLAEVERGSPFFDLGAGENLIEFHTRRYADVPLVVRGPGAGPGVTAAGVLNDILRAAAGAAGLSRGGSE